MSTTPSGERPQDAPHYTPGPQTSPTKRQNVASRISPFETSTPWLVGEDSPVVSSSSIVSPSSTTSSQQSPPDQKPSESPRPTQTPPDDPKYSAPTRRLLALFNDPSLTDDEKHSAYLDIVYTMTGAEVRQYRAEIGRPIPSFPESIPYDDGLDIYLEEHGHFPGESSCTSDSDADGAGI